MSNRAERSRGPGAPLALLLATLLFVFTAGQALAAAPVKVLVLPFQVNADAAAAGTGEDFSQALAQRLSAQGLPVLPDSEMRALLQRRNVRSLDLATVRSLLKASGASHAVYGSVNQAGAGLSVDARLISGAGAAKPLYVEQRQAGATVNYAVDDLAKSVSGEINYSAAAAAPTQPEPAGREPGMAPVAGSGPIIAGVEVRGTRFLDPEVILMRVNTRKGDRVDAATIDNEVKSIWNLGYFSDVRVAVENRADGAYLVYTVVEKPKLETIKVEGAKEVDEDDVLGAMGTKTGTILNESLLADDIQKIIELYRKKGFYLAKVDYRVDTRADGAGAGLILSINEGKKLYIEHVNIEGATKIDADDIKSKMMLKERGLLSFFTGTGILKEELIERDSAVISTYYLDRGYIDAHVGAAKLDYSDEGITITFPVTEGEQYILNNVIITGELIDTEEHLRAVTSMDELAAKHEPFNLTVMQNDARKLTDYYSDFGYAYADVTGRPQKVTEGGNKVDVIYQVQKKSKIFVNKVTVEGNNKTRDNVILREMQITDGEPFEGSKLRRSTERLNKLGYFEVAEAELVPTNQEDEVDIKVKVKERPTGALMGGFGYSTFSSFGVSASIMERNLWGKGYYLALQAALSGRRNAYTLSFTNPRWDDTPLAMGFDLYNTREDYYDYKKKTSGFVARFGYPIGEYSSIGWGYRFDVYDIYDVDNENVSHYINDYADETRYSSVGILKFLRDSTDRERPTNGNIDLFHVEYGGGLLGGDDDFITLTLEHQTYYELATNHVLHARLKGQALFNNGSGKPPVFERFWMGGMSSVRGYNSRDIVPRDPKTDDYIGGTRMAFANFEYIWSISNEVGVNLVPFFDIGFNIDTDHKWNWDDEIKKSVGLEVRWRSPMGDLRFAYGIPLDDDRSGRRRDGRFEFSMGQFF